MKNKDPRLSKDNMKKSAIEYNKLQIEHEDARREDFIERGLPVKTREEYFEDTDKKRIANKISSDAFTARGMKPLPYKTEEGVELSTDIRWDRIMIWGEDGDLVEEIMRKFPDKQPDNECSGCGNWLPHYLEVNSCPCPTMVVY